MSDCTWCGVQARDAKIRSLEAATAPAAEQGLKTAGSMQAPGRPRATQPGRHHRAASSPVAPSQSAANDHVETEVHFLSRLSPGSLRASKSCMCSQAAAQGLQLHCMVSCPGSMRMRALLALQPCSRQHPSSMSSGD